MKRADIQGMRAIAVLLVLMFHFETPLRGGYLGVDMFFVISGFVIASSTLRELDSTSHFSWSAFLNRRVRRLLPGLAVVTLATALLSMLFMSPFGPQQETAKMLLSAATYTSNYVLMPQDYFSLDAKANPMLHLWSLAVEEQFYFVWPVAIIALVGMRKHIQKNVFRVTYWIIILGAGLLSLRLFLNSSINGSQVNDLWWFKPLIQRDITPERFAFYSPFTRAWEFLIGVLVALIMRHTKQSHLRTFRSALSFGGLSLFVCGIIWATQNPEVIHDGNRATNTSATIAAVVGTALLIYGSSKNQTINKLISSRPLTLIGDRSYSIYLLHWPIWVLLITLFKQTNALIVIAFVLSMSLGSLQFRYIEAPIRSKRNLQKPNTIKFVGVFGFVSLIVFAVMSQITPRIAVHLAGKKPDELTLHIIEQPCNSQIFAFESASSCMFPSAGNLGNAVLVGDSMAKSLSEGFIQASNLEGLNGYVFSFPGCAYQWFDSPFAATSECANWRANVSDALQELQPKVLLISNLNSLYVENALPDRSIDDTQLIWGSEMDRTMERLVALGSKVIVVQPPPRFEYDLRYDISLIGAKSVKESRNFVVSRGKEINEIEAKAIEKYEFVQPIVNLFDLFCDNTLCDPKKDGKFMFEDDDHLSVDGSLYISPVLQEAIHKALN